MNLTRLIIRFFKKELYLNIKLAQKIEFKNTDEVKLIQEQKFIKLINHANNNVPYYKGKFDEIKNLDDLSKINFLSKENILNNTESLKAKNINEKRIFKDSTSGSTGKSLYYFRDSLNYYRKAVGYRCDARAGYNIGSKVLYLWGADRDILNNKSLYKKLKDKFIYKEKRMSTYHMTKDDMKNYVNELNTFKPDIVIAYPTPLFYFADFLEKNNIKTRQLKGIITSAETLFPFQREKIEKVFNCKIFNRYGCREVGNIASECEVHDGLHINSDHVVVEIINSNGEQCETGELGEVVITELDEYAFPLIRYKIGDIGVLSNNLCSCGRGLPLLKTIEGRVFDLIIGENGNMVGGTFWTLLKHKINGWDKFQIIQEKKGQVHIIVENNSEIKDDFNIRLIKIVKEKLGDNMKVKVDIVDKIPLTKTGKFRWVISKISPYAK